MVRIRSARRRLSAVAALLLSLGLAGPATSRDSDRVEGLPASQAGHSSLRGRYMFGYYDEQAPEAAVFNVQERRAEQAQIARLVRAGFLVRTRADADTREARANDVSRLNAAIASGAQFVSSDYYDAVPNPHGYAYRASLPGGALHRCNPVSAPCADAPPVQGIR